MLVLLDVGAAPADTLMTMVVVTGTEPVGLIPRTSPLGRSEVTDFVVTSRKPNVVRSERTTPAVWPT